jgi:hypothetical protein
MSLTGPNGVTYKIFEQVRVKIYVQEAKSRRKWLQIDLLEKGAAKSQPQQAIAKHLLTAPAQEAVAAAPAAAAAVAAAPDAAVPVAAARASKKRDIVELSEDDAEVEEVAPKAKGKKSAAPTTTPSKQATKKK